MWFLWCTCCFSANYCVMNIGLLAVSDHIWMTTSCCSNSKRSWSSKFDCESNVQWYSQCTKQKANCYVFYYCSYIDKWSTLYFYPMSMLVVVPVIIYLLISVNFCSFTIHRSTDSFVYFFSLNFTWLMWLWFWVNRLSLAITVPLAHFIDILVNNKWLSCRV